MVSERKISRLLKSVQSYHMILLNTRSPKLTTVCNFSGQTWKNKFLFLSFEMSKHKMKLITNENNIDALKIAICAYEVKQRIEVVLGTSSGDLVPSLIDESSDLKLFVVNSACLFLHENAQSLSGKTIEEVKDLLDWEASVLRPILSTYHATKKVSLTHL